MGRDKQSGFGYGMNETDARMDFIKYLNRTFGESTSDGITEWLKSRCLENPILASAPSKTKSVKVPPPISPGKLVNGFIVTNETPELIRKQITARFGHGDEPQVFEEFTLTQSDAKKKAEEMAKEHDMSIHVLPSRLFQDKRTKKLSVPNRILEVTPIEGKAAKMGMWRFEVEVRN